ncbi:hypothetical protein P7K49_020583 [Saguinus oedipus]|uniref:Uncharacterized protein n=1 Tax=Saguinus oedipus TaxID=9490 RepID=A0ABQ9V102_SAGOE|nr:hypothetical protein P7K49_020583 [Saguinus oedipus]
MIVAVAKFLVVKMVVEDDDSGIVVMLEIRSYNRNGGDDGDGKNYVGGDGSDVEVTKVMMVEVMADVMEVTMMEMRKVIMMEVAMEFLLVMLEVMKVMELVELTEVMMMGEVMEVMMEEVSAVLAAMVEVTG